MLSPHLRIWDAVLCCVVAGAIAAVLTPLAARVARRVGAVDVPRERGLAERATPLLGGLAILAAVAIGALIFLPDTITLPRSARAGSGHIAVDTWGLMAGAGLITLVGAIDDRRALPPWLKLLGQIAAAVVAVRAGAKVTDVTIPFVGALQFPNEGGELTVVWLVALMNVVNFTDGVDGLAAGLCAIDGVAFAIISLSLHVPGAALLAALTAGASLGFLVHNFYPAKVFMGDAGANLLGYLLGVAAVIGSLKTNAVAKRLKYGRKPWSADANHFHHRMARIGFSQRKTVAYLYAWSATLAGLAVAMRLLPYHPHNSHYDWLWVGVLIAFGVFALAASVYLVIVLEILKFRRLRSVELHDVDPGAGEGEIKARVNHDVETGEFKRIRSPS
jgi:UDP-GlcNAc:undecaprenyl-phosphate GlcNAc-1-phosphate transferase